MAGLPRVDSAWSPVSLQPGGEDQRAPQSSPMVCCARSVCLNAVPELVSGNPARDPVRQRVQQVGARAAKPGADGCAEALLLAREYLRGEEVRDRLPQDPLASDFDCGRQGYELPNAPPCRTQESPTTPWWVTKQSTIKDEQSEEKNGKCMTSFSSLRALSAHQRFCSLPGHGLRTFASLATVNNECPKCKTAFQTRDEACAHFDRSLRSGKCLKDLTAYPYKVKTYHH